jgi:hypothetical protein
MREKTVIALFDRFDTAKAAVSDIIVAGANRDRIAMLANDSSGDHPALMTNPAYAREEFDADSNAQSGIVTGAEIGIGVGGLLGFLASSVAIPGIGLLVSAGVWVSIGIGAVIFGAIGAGIGAWTDHGVSDKDSKLYAEGLKRGGTLVTVQIADDQADKIEQILKRAGSVNIGQREPNWPAEGWVTFDPGDGLLGGAHAA